MIHDKSDIRLALSPKKAADALDVSRITIWRLIRDKKLQVIHVSERCTRITMASLNEYIAERLEAEAS
jgi:excisionase family DNA binding protein